MSEGGHGNHADDVVACVGVEDESGKGVHGQSVQRSICSIKLKCNVSEIASKLSVVVKLQMPMTQTERLHIRCSAHLGPGSRRVINGLTNICRATKVFGTKLWGRGHDGLVNCVRTGMSKSVSISKTFVAANAIYSHKFAGHNALVSTFVATYDYSPVIFSVVVISRNR